ncbi:TonB family protein [Hyalangium rubrum]|uniref:TonB family protein n=1 Tax=Hyalangium rubrum TaxID=3103134 RepID=A0ABU5HGC7_9BACT|nr:TonB family protein [Hyalangium sp. s54d21]MDY7232421.1 TonB family protein [Hyalangium sp. s54d21]
MSRLHLLVSATVALALLLTPVARAAGVRAQLQTFFQANLTSTDYQKKLFDRFARSYRQPGAKHVPKPGQRTVVQAVIGRDGKLVTTLVSMESGSKGWDEAALKAVKKAAPFEPLPDSYTAPTLEVHFHVSWSTGS